MSALAGAAGPCSRQGCRWVPHLPALPGLVEGAAMPGQGATIPSVPGHSIMPRTAVVQRDPAQKWVWL